MTNMYNPEEYWKKRGISEDNFQVPDDQTKDQSEKLRSILQQLGLIKSVIEIGCGNGRLSNILFQTKIEIEEYVGIDISKDRLDRWKQNLAEGLIKPYKCAAVQLFDIPFEKLHLKKKKDLIFASQVLLHVKDTEIENFMRSMINQCSKYIVHIDWWQQEYVGRIESHCFKHDYETLWTQLGKKVEIIPTLGNQAIFVVDI